MTCVWLAAAPALALLSQQLESVTVRQSIFLSRYGRSLAVRPASRAHGTACIKRLYTCTSYGSDRTTHSHPRAASLDFYHVLPRTTMAAPCSPEPPRSPHPLHPHRSRRYATQTVTPCVLRPLLGSTLSATAHASTHTTMPEALSQRSQRGRRPHMLLRASQHCASPPLEHTLGSPVRGGPAAHIHNNKQGVTAATIIAPPKRPTAHQPWRTLSNASEQHICERCMHAIPGSTQIGDAIGTPTCPSRSARDRTKPRARTQARAARCMCMSIGMQARVRKGAPIPSPSAGREWP